MADRWNPKWVTRPVERESKVFVPGDDPSARNVLLEVFGGREVSSQHRVTMHPAGFRVHERGALDAKVVHSYRCPVHGVVDVRVPRDAVPDALNCAELTESWAEDVNTGARMQMTCGRPAAWAGSFCGQGHAAGEVTS